MNRAHGGENRKRLRRLSTGRRIHLWASCREALACRVRSTSCGVSGRRGGQCADHAGENALGGLAAQAQRHAFQRNLHERGTLSRGVDTGTNAADRDGVGIGVGLEEAGSALARFLPFTRCR